MMSTEFPATKGIPISMFQSTTIMLHKSNSMDMDSKTNDDVWVNKRINSCSVAVARAGSQPDNTGFESEMHPWRICDNLELIS